MEEQVEMGIKLEKREKRITRIAEAEGIEVYRRAVIVGEVHGWGEPDERKASEMHVRVHSNSRWSSEGRTKKARINQFVLPCPSLRFIYK